MALRPVSRPAPAVCLVVLALLATASPALAQSPPYKFTRIADSVQNPGAHIGGVHCVGVNNLGTVIVTTTTTSYVLWRGDGGPFEPVESNLQGPCGSINDLDEVSYTVSGNNTTLLVKNDHGIRTTIASRLVAPFLHSQTTYLPSLNNNGNTVFVSGSNGSGIFIGPIGTAVFDPALHGALSFFVSPASMNASEQVVFAGSTPAGAAIFTNTALPLLRDGQAISGGILRLSGGHRPSINDAGTVAFHGRLDAGGATGVSGVYTSPGGSASVALAGSNPVDRFSLNNGGSVVYRKTLSGGAGSGVYIGRPGAIDRTVLAQGDAIDGSTLRDGFIWEESLNDLGQVAFWAHLADGRRGVYRADPQWLKSLSLAKEVPGCGPISGKITLTAPAPPGGLTIELENTNAAAAVPATVTVAAGKKAATFTITPSPVVNAVAGDIGASVGGQTLGRRLTVRPISVKTLTLSPNPVSSGSGVTGTVTLDCGAAPQDLAVALSSSKPAIAQPTVPSLLFPAGTHTLVFSIATGNVNATTSATIKASARGISKGKKLTVIPPG